MENEKGAFKKHELEEFMGYRMPQDEYQRYLTSAEEAVHKRKLWGRGNHPVDKLNQEPIHLQGQPLFRVVDGYLISDADTDSDSHDVMQSTDDPGMPNVEQCPCTIL